MAHLEAFDLQYLPRKNPQSRTPISKLKFGSSSERRDFINHYLQLIIEAFGEQGLISLFGSKEIAHQKSRERLELMLNSDHHFTLIEDIWLGYDSTQGSPKGPFDSLLASASFDAYTTSFTLDMLLNSVKDTSPQEIEKARRLVKSAIQSSKAFVTIIDRMRLDTPNARKNMSEMREEFFQSLKSREALYFTTARPLAVPIYKKLAIQNRFTFIVDLPINNPETSEEGQRLIIGKFDNY